MRYRNPSNNTEFIECKDVLEMVEQVFSQDPKLPNTFQIDLETDSGMDEKHQVFRTLGQFLTHGMVFLYGDDVNVGDLTDNQIKKLKDYMLSLGWKAIINPPLSPDNYPLSLPWKLSIPISASQQVFAHVIFEPNI